MNPAALEQTAEHWATTLDDDDFSSLPHLMTPNCAYDSPSGRLKGREAIVDSYRSNSEWAHDTFDNITWQSSVEVEGEDSALITFVDLTEHRGQHHEYRCQQRIWIEDGLVHRIQHIDLDGESEALEAYFVRVGVTRPGV